jgi:hypothetical protein
MKFFLPVAISGASQLISIAVVVWLYRTPSELFVIAAIMKCRGADRRGYNREVGLVNGPEEIKIELRREWDGKENIPLPATRSNKNSFRLRFFLNQPFARQKRSVWSTICNLSFHGFPEYPHHDLMCSRADLVCLLNERNFLRVLDQPGLLDRIEEVSICYLHHSRV